MKKILSVLVVIIWNILMVVEAQSQSLPAGTPILEDYYRRMQILGKLDSSISFTIRPLSNFSYSLKNTFDPDTSLNNDRWLNFDGIYSTAKGQVKVHLLPITWQQQYNSNQPYGWNDGAMIPAKGYQTMLSGGVFAKLGPLSIQLRPEYVYAANQDFEILDIYQGAPDIQSRFGNTAYHKTTWGQSSIRLTFGPVSMGLSNENLWWGPGMRNSLLMSNNAPGFKHLTFNTVRPLRTPVGSLEMQVISAKLEGSGYSILESDPHDSDWRYLSALVINYQPKWIPGVFLGLTRSFQAYHKDLRGSWDYIPFFTPYQKINTNDGDPFDRDQLTSVYLRWLFTKAHAEVYLEFGKNDNDYNWRDFIGAPEHSRAYIVGMRKLVPLKSSKEEFIQVNAEITQMSQSIDRLIRNSGAWYYHSGVNHGYTHKGEVLGAGVGPSGNLQSLDVSWIKGFKKIGLQLERYVHDDDYYYNVFGDLNGKSRKWVDFSTGMQAEWNYKNLLLNAKLQMIKSLNYQWKLKDFDSSVYYIPNNDKYNFSGQIGITYRF
ncbi:MAG: capsule assembly Wzi family protein [Daejeonella sp.]